MPSKAPTRSVRSGSRAGSVKTGSGGKASGGKKQETCSKCSNPDKNLRLLECSHAYCPSCLKTIVKAPAPEGKDGGRSSRMSQKGGKKGAPPAGKEQYECPICTPQPSAADSKNGECAPCKFEEKSSPANGFCVECSELLCDNCCTEHNKFKTIRAHTILRDDKIPRDTGAVARLPLIMMCLTHPDKDLEYYCADHDVMVCGACVNTDHRRCERVMFIKDITDAPTDRKAVADAAVELRDIRKNFEDIHRDTGEIIISLEQQRAEIRERRDNYRNRIMELLDKLDSSSELEMEQVIQNVSKDMGDDSQSSQQILSQIDSSIQILDAAASHANDMQLFVAGRRSTTDREKYVNMLNNAMGSIQNVRLDFKPDPTLERLAKSLELFDGRTISSNSTRYNQKQRNTFEPQNGFVDRRNQMMNGNGYENMRRPGSDYSGTATHFQNGRQNAFPEEMGRQNSLMTGSVPDLGNAGYRSSMMERSMIEFNGNGSMRSHPQSPRRLEYGNQFQTRSMPPTPRLVEMNNPLPRSNTGQEQTFFERQMHQHGVLPMIPPRGAQSESGLLEAKRSRDFAPISPRSVGHNNGLLDAGLGQSQTNVDRLTINHASMSRRGSIASTMSIPPIPTNRDPPSKPAAFATEKSNILSQTSPIKRRSELTTGTTSLRERKAVLAGQFNVRLAEDSNVCGLKGVTFLQDGRIVMADYDNHNVKMFDSKLYRGSQLRLSSGPWDVEATGPKEVAVTLPFESKIQFISVTESMKSTRAIKMDMDCYGIVCRNSELIVVCNDYLIGPAVQVLSMTGRVKQTIDTDRSGRRILTDPYYLTVTPTGKLIYVSDKDRIVCMDRHGNVTSIYQDANLRNARGIDIDNEGNLYVCGYMSNNVHQITMHGIDFRCLVDKEQVWDPWSVRFSESNGTILVTCDASDTIKVFSLQ